MSESNRVNLIIAEETVFNEATATQSGLELSFASETVDHEKETAESDLLRNDRHLEDVIEVGVGAAGDLQTELIFGAFDKLIAAGLGSTFGAFSGVTVDKAMVQAVAASQKLIRSDVGGSWVVDGFTVDQWVRTRGFSNADNNGLFKVSAVTATDLTLTSGTDTFVDEAANTGRVVQGLFGTTCVAGVNIETTATTVVRASGSFVTDGFQVGQRVRLIGFTGGDVGNNQIVKITGVVALTLTVEASPALTVTSAAAGRAIFGDHVRDGVIKRSFAAQRKYEDLTNKFISYRGLRVSKFSLTIAARSIMKLAFTLMGTKGVSGSSAFISTSTPASKNRVYAAGTNVASVKEGGAVLSQACSEFSFEVDAGLYAVDTIESKEHESIDLGTTMIKGKAKLYFKNFDYYDKFQNHTESSWEVQARDGDLNVYHYTIPSIRYTASPIGTPGKNQSLFADMSWTAIHNNTFNCEMMIDRIPV